MSSPRAQVPMPNRGVMLRSRAMVLDEMAARERRWADTGNPEVLSLIDEWTAARTRLANLYIYHELLEPVKKELAE